MNNKPRILVIGTVAVDLTAKIGGIPAYDTVSVEGKYEFVPGSRGAVAAHTIAALGGEAIFCGKVGRDSFGGRLADTMRAVGVDCRYMLTDKSERTGLRIILSEANGRNRIIYYPCANSSLTADDVEQAFSCYPDAVYITLDVPAKTAIEAVKYARMKNIPVFVDAAGAGEDFPYERLEMLEMFSPDEDEAYAISGVRPSSYSRYMKTASLIAKRIPSKYYAIKLGDRGVYLSEVVKFYVIAPYNTNVVDRAGVGDIFTAAMTLEYMRSYDARRAADFGCLTAALSMSKQGSFKAVPTKEELKSFIEKYNIDFKL